MDKISPCKFCENDDSCFLPCVKWRKWFSEIWEKTCEPFRKLKKGDKE